MATADRLPDGFIVRLGRRVRVEDGGRTLVGGAPLRMLHLTPAAARRLNARELVVSDAASAALADLLLGTGVADPVIERLAPSRFARDDVTVVVPVRDRARQLERLLEGLGTAFPGRVIVVDDASDDAGPVRRVAEAHGARVASLAENLGPAGARNHGLGLVETPLVLFVDSDAVLEPAAVELMLKHFADPAVAVVAPRIVGLEVDRPTAVERYEAARASLDLGRLPALVRPRSRVSWVSSTCLLGRVDALGEGFGEGMRVAEDVDLVWRLDAEGHRVRYEPAAVARHELRTGMRAWFGRKAFYGTGAHPLALRHPQEIAPAVLAPWSAAMMLALLAQRRWSLPVAGVIVTATIVRLARRLPRSSRPVASAARLVADGAVASFVQASALLLRHWWPGAVAAALFSRRMRRALAVAAVVDALFEWRRTRAELDPLRFAVLRRLDDIAYGTGVWLSAWRGRSLAALRPSLRSRVRATATPRS